MKSRLRPWLLLIGVALLAACVWIILLPYIQTGHAPDWTGFGSERWTVTGSGSSVLRSTHLEIVQARDLWAWLELLVVPLVVAVVGIWFTWRQSETERRIAARNQYEAALEGYVDRMVQFLPRQGESLDAHERTLIASRTVAALRRLDGEHNASMLDYLRQWKLVDVINDIFAKAHLRGVDLSGADLRELNLSGVDLRETKLIEANLSRANLSGANLVRANLEGATLRGAMLKQARLGGANLSGADLDDAVLEQANLIAADLCWATCRRSKMKGANLSYAWLDHANFLRAEVDENTSIPQLTEHTSRWRTLMPDGRYSRWKRFVRRYHTAEW